MQSRTSEAEDKKGTVRWNNQKAGQKGKWMTKNGTAYMTTALASSTSHIHIHVDIISIPRSFRCSSAPRVTLPNEILDGGELMLTTECRKIFHANHFVVRTDCGARAQIGMLRSSAPVQFIVPKMHFPYWGLLAHFSLFNYCVRNGIRG